MQTWQSWYDTWFMFLRPRFDPGRRHVFFYPGPWAVDSSGNTSSGCPTSTTTRSAVLDAGPEWTRIGRGVHAHITSRLQSKKQKRVRGVRECCSEYCLRTSAHGAHIVAIIVALCGAPTAEWRSCTAWRARCVVSTTATHGRASGAPTGTRSESQPIRRCAAPWSTFRRSGSTQPDPKRISAPSASPSSSGVEYPDPGTAPETTPQRRAEGGEGGTTKRQPICMQLQARTRRIQSAGYNRVSREVPRSLGSSGDRGDVVRYQRPEEVADVDATRQRP
jgi:hypothetical protein